MPGVCAAPQVLSGGVSQVCLDTHAVPQPAEARCVAVQLVVGAIRPLPALPQLAERVVVSPPTHRHPVVAAARLSPETILSGSPQAPLGLSGNPVFPLSDQPATGAKSKDLLAANLQAASCGFWAAWWCTRFAEVQLACCVSNRAATKPIHLPPETSQYTSREPAAARHPSQPVCLPVNFHRCTVGSQTL